MGSEILDSSGRVHQAAPDLWDPVRDGAVDGAPDIAFVDLADLGDVSPPAQPHRPRTRRRTGVWSGLRRVVTDRRRRRAAVAGVAAAAVLVLLTGLAVSTHEHRQVAAAGAARLAVDARIDQLPQLTGDSEPAPLPTDDEFSVQVLIHNLGPRTVQLTGVTYVTGRSRQSSGTLFKANVAIAAGQQLDQGFRARLPCNHSGSGPVGPVLVTAHLRTADGRTHTEPINTDALEDFGGLFQACSEFQAASAGFGAQVNSEVHGRSVRMSVTVTGQNDPPDREVHVSMARAGVPSQVHFVSSPPLPWVTTIGRTDTVVITPVVHGCPKSVDTDAINAIGLSINGQTQADEYLPLVTAEAIGRACGAKR
jgi:hypothetical protein